MSKSSGYIAHCMAVKKQAWEQGQLRVIKLPQENQKVTAALSGKTHG
jgi:hypothetical protein